MKKEIKAQVDIPSFVYMVAQEMDKRKLTGEDVNQVYSIIHDKVMEYLSDPGVFEDVKYYFKESGVPKNDLDKDFITDRIFEQIVNKLEELNILGPEEEEES